MALLGQLRLFQRVVIGLEIGAGIVHVGIEKLAVERAGKIVVMRDMGARLAAIIGLALFALVGYERGWYVFM